MDALWTPARQARLSRAVRGASKSLGDADVQRLGERMIAWTDAWVLSSAEIDSASRRGRLSHAEASAGRACLEVERVEYAALLDGLNQRCQAPGCQAERVAQLEWELIAAVQSTRACTQPAFFKAYLSSNLAEPEALDIQGHFLALEALGEERLLGRYLAGALARHRSPSPLRTRLLLLEARRMLRSTARPTDAIELLDAGLAEAEGRGDALETASLRAARSDANLELARFDAARKDAQLALQHTERALGPDHVQTALARATYAWILLCTYSPEAPLELDTAARQLDHARVALTRALGPTHPLTARIELGLGQVAALRNDPGASQRWLTRGTSSTAVAFGAQHLAMADAVRCNASAESALGAPRTGALLFKRALEIEERILGDMHPRIASANLNLGIAYRGVGRTDWSIGRLRKALSIRAQLGLPRRDEDALIWHELGLSQQLAKQPRSALKSYQASLALYRQLYGDTHPEVMSMLDAFRKALDAREANPSTPYDLALALTEVAAVEVDLDQFEQAKRHAERAERLSRRLPAKRRARLQSTICHLLSQTYAALTLEQSEAPSCSQFRSR